MSSRYRSLVVSIVPHQFFDSFESLNTPTHFSDTSAWLQYARICTQNMFGPQVCDEEHTTGLHACWSGKKHSIQSKHGDKNQTIWFIVFCCLLFAMCLRHHLHVGFSCVELTWNLEALVSVFTANLLSYTVLVKCLHLCASARVSAFPWACRHAHETLCNSRVWNLSGVAQHHISVPMTGCQNLFQGPWAEPVQASPWTPWRSGQVLQLVKPGCRCQETRKLSLMPLEESLLPQFPSRYLTACSLLH